MTLFEVKARAQLMGVKICKLPQLAPMYGITLGDRIFVKREDDAALLEHELVHVVQQRKDGWRFFWRYATDKKARALYEAEAYKTNIASGDMYVETAAQILSGALYLRCCTYEEALELLRA